MLSHRATFLRNVKRDLRHRVSIWIPVCDTLHWTRVRFTDVVRASLGDAIVRRARQDAAKVADVLNSPVVKGAAVGLFAAAALSVPNVNALTKADIDQLTYMQVKGKCELSHFDGGCQSGL